MTPFCRMDGVYGPPVRPSAVFTVHDGQRRLPQWSTRCSRASRREGPCWSVFDDIVSHPLASDTLSLEYS